MALITDAGHMVANSVAIGLALLNALSLWLVIAWISVEAYRRFIEPPEVQGF